MLVLQPSLTARAYAPVLAEPSDITAWQRQLPNALTVARVLAIPPFVAAFCSPAAMRLRLPAAIFAALSMTDLADGFLARRWGVESAFGAFLDPLADKLLVDKNPLSALPRPAAPAPPRSPRPEQRRRASPPGLRGARVAERLPRPCRRRADRGHRLSRDRSLRPARVRAGPGASFPLRSRGWPRGC